MEHKILLVDDEPGVLQGLRRRLRGRYRVDVAESGAEALSRIQQDGPFSVIVSDMRMPEMDGAELLERIARTAPDTVRIMLTGNSDQHTAVEAVNRGRIFRFLNKPCPSGELETALDQGIEAFEAAKGQHQAFAQALDRVQALSERLCRQGRHDRLTDLLDPESFIAETAQWLASPHPGATLVYLNLDNFRLWRETYGQLASDELLRNFAGLLRADQGPADLCARLGGDVFAMLLPGQSAGPTARRLETLQTELKQMQLPWADKGLGIGFSAGFAEIAPAQPGEAGQLLDLVELACHVAKEQGGGRIHQAAPGDPALTHRRREVQSLADFNQALLDDRFEVYFQPIVPVVGISEQLHLEILVRMLDDQGRPRGPGEFLPVAEKYRLTPKLDLWVVDRVLQWLHAHEDLAARISVCAINLSGHSLSRPDVLAEIARLVERSGVRFESLAFEVTENAALTNMSLAVEFMTALRARGCRFSLDDFGSGLSSFGYLQALPVDYLKIDGSFVRDLETNTTNRALVRAINDVGHALGKLTIAEYVENEAIRQILAAMGVDYAQGYGIARPQPLRGLV